MHESSHMNKRTWALKFARDERYDQIDRPNVMPMTQHGEMCVVCRQTGKRRVRLLRKPSAKFVHTKWIRVEFEASEWRPNEFTLLCTKQYRSISTAQRYSKCKENHWDKSSQQSATKQNKTNWTESRRKSKIKQQSQWINRNWAGIEIRISEVICLCVCSCTVVGKRASLLRRNWFSVLVSEFPKSTAK